jgi:hypothetical protein
VGPSHISTHEQSSLKRFVTLDRQAKLDRQSEGTEELVSARHLIVEALRHALNMRFAMYAVKRNFCRSPQALSASSA